MISDKLRHSRLQRVVEFASYCNRLLDSDRSRFPRMVLRKLEKYRRQFQASSNDKILGELFCKDLEVLDAVVKYVNAINAGNTAEAQKLRDDAIQKWNESDIIANRISEEVEKDGN